MSDSVPGIKQHVHHLANGCSLVERIDAGRPEGFDAPPQRRWRVVADIGGDTIDDIRRALEEIDLALARGNVCGGTSGGVSGGWHWERIERDTDHDAFIDELRAWRSRGRAERTMKEQT